MFYTDKIKQSIDERLKLVSKSYDYLLEKNAELIEKNKSLSEKICQLDNRIDKLEAEKDRIYKLISQVQDNITDEADKRFSILNSNLEKKDIDIETKLMCFRKEMLDEICGKFFDTLDRIFRTSKEISLITRLIDNNGSDLGQLRSQLLKPFIEAKHREERIKQGEEIVNKGQKIVETRNKLYEEMIEKQRKGENIFNLKFKIEVYDEIIKMAK